MALKLLAGEVHNIDRHYSVTCVGVGYIIDSKFLKFICLKKEHWASLRFPVTLTWAKL